MKNSALNHIKFMNKGNHFKDYRKKNLLRVVNQSDYVNNKESLKDIALILCPPWGTHHPPLSLAYLSSYLRSRNLSVDVFDVNINVYNNCYDRDRIFWDMGKFKEWFLKEKFDNLLGKFDNLIDYEIEKILKTKYKLLCFSVNLGNLLMTREFISRIKKKSNPLIIAGGQGVYKKEWRKTLDQVDYFIVSGDYESLYDLFKSLTYSKNQSIIPGVIKTKNGTESEYIKRNSNFRELPSLDFAKFNLHKYERNVLPFILSKGCIQRCLFCGEVYYSPKFYQKEPKAVFEELYYLYKKHGIKRFLSQDLLINGDLEKLENLCDLIISSDMEIDWEGQAIIREMPERLFVKLKKSGMSTIIFGLETASDRLLKLMNKKHTAKLAEDIIRKAARAGIHVLVNIIIGLPGEEETDFFKTKFFLVKNRFYITAVLNLNVCEIHQECGLYKQKEKLNIKIVEGKNKHPWWYDDKGNTIELRMQHLNKMELFLSEIGIPVFNSNKYFYEFI